MEGIEGLVDLKPRGPKVYRILAGDMASGDAPPDSIDF